MPSLILVKGAPANGKSTMARLYVENHPLALNLDIDQVRAMFGRWRDDAGTAGLRARAIALAAAQRTGTIEAAVPVTESALTGYYDRLAAILPTRPAARIVETVDGDPAATYRRVLGSLSIVD